MMTTEELNDKPTGSNDGRTPPMTDLINRADALAAVTLGDTVTALHRKIAAIPAVTPLAQVRVMPPVGWVISNGQGNRWRCVWKWETNAEWTDDRSKALKFATREDAEAFSAEDEDAWLIQDVPIPAIYTAPDPRDAVIARLVEAGSWLSVCAQTTGGTAGRDDDLVNAISGWTAALAAAKEVQP